MKTLRNLTAVVALMITCSFAKADEPAVNLTRVHAINTYLDAMTRGKIEGLNQVVDASAKFSILRGKSIVSFDKKQMTDFLKEQKNVEQTCTTNTEVVESNSHIAVVKVDMKYNGFTRSNYVTIANTGNGWKITNVYSVFS
ncbi:nuclear transport factor 2 family protein [Mucilaginibacter achroorhodeus]|uniref:Nuclear transport factor 2 family protein n=1 Tax=Mucilaginibacter achroorhodeus TaxID=2599294 RepID=A0A563TYL1_9SPHI|nr:MULTISPECIES: nuclear transport factor 2 family protein [Mucilaginibacter]QXV65438.1 nuclear transport factor 2 family protein [Mucilaginibacter sp. 21P]TWR24457.1 nuclear transport factor 2 family protein [Mucilaginibacter achroorhodeus]